MIEVRWSWLTRKSKRKVLERLKPKIEATRAQNPGLSFGQLARMYGIPKSSLYDVMSENKQKGTTGIRGLKRYGQEKESSGGMSESGQQKGPEVDNTLG